MSGWLPSFCRTTAQRKNGSKVAVALKANSAVRYLLRVRHAKAGPVETRRRGTSATTTQTSPHGTTKTPAVRKRRADQASARASATSEFTGPRCGRGSRAPCCRARARRQRSKRLVVGSWPYVIWNCKIYTLIRLQLESFDLTPFGYCRSQGILR